MASHPTPPPDTAPSSTLGRRAAALRAFLARPRFPWVLGLLAAILMLPALGTDLIMDDLVQRVLELKPEQLPPQIQQTGFGSPESGKLRTVLCDLFGLSRRPESLAQAKDFGLLAWWMREDIRAALWRPFTAFTHWLDYRLFPNTPALMHAHSIAWFAAAVVLAAISYRTIHGAAAGTGPESAPHSAQTSWVAGLAASLFLLDKNTFFPVMFVANRGFIVSFCFGMFCLYEHHRWRTGKSSWHLAGSVVSLALALAANEGGVSSLAFLLAYALVLETSSWRKRALSVLPAVAVIAGWRVLYVAMGFGVANLGGYIDPGYEPALFLRQVFQRMALLLGGQLSGVPPESIIVFNPLWRTVIGSLFVVICLACGAVFWPVVRSHRAARFWCLAMLFALVPAATVIPLSKNLAFVALGAFGVLASFFARVVSAPRPSGWSVNRVAVCTVAACLFVVHVPGALTGRVLMASACRELPGLLKRACGFSRFADMGDRHVVIVNSPSQLGVMAAPFIRAYHAEPIPASLRTLLPANTSFRLTRQNETTLIAEAKGLHSGKDLFACDDLGPKHLCYALQSESELLAGKSRWQNGDRVFRKQVSTEVLEVSERGAPGKVAFHFDQTLDSPAFLWIYFDWSSFTYQRFSVPRIGETVEVHGPEVGRK